MRPLLQGLSMKNSKLPIFAACLALGTSALAADDKPKGHLWILSELSYELPSNTNTSFEVGIFGFCGLGAAYNMYSNGKTGLMYTGRVGYLGAGVAANALVSYVGNFNESISWRIGAGIGYFKGSGYFGDVNGAFPVLDLSIGFKL